jgi:hypothetical protein
MNKYLIYGLIILFIITGLYRYFYHQSRNPAYSKKEGVEFRLYLIQEKEEQKGEGDTYYISLLKQLREKVDGWLKSINERIEKEDITRLEVRFLEILRSILEWVRGKIDSKLESLKEKSPPKRQEMYRET